MPTSVLLGLASFGVILTISMASNYTRENYAKVVAVTSAYTTLAILALLLFSHYDLRVQNNELRLEIYKIQLQLKK